MTTAGSVQLPSSESVGLSSYRRDVRSHSLPGYADDFWFHYLASVQSGYKVPGPVRWV